MERQDHAFVCAEDGRRGVIEAEPFSGHEVGEQVVVRFDDGMRIAVPRGLLSEQPDGSYHLPLGASDIEQLGAESGHAVAAAIPVVTEELDVRKRTVETGRVRVSKTAREREVVVDEPLLRERVDVERVAVNRVVDGPVAIRNEGDVTIIPVLEEVIVVEKRLMLKEELRLTKRRVEEHIPQRVTLRTEEAFVERVGNP